MQGTSAITIAIVTYLLDYGVFKHYAAHFSYDVNLDQVGRADRQRPTSPVIPMPARPRHCHRVFSLPPCHDVLAGLAGDGEPGAVQPHRLLPRMLHRHTCVSQHAWRTTVRHHLTCLARWLAVLSGGFARASLMVESGGKSQIASIVSAILIIIAVKVGTCPPPPPSPAACPIFAVSRPPSSLLALAVVVCVRHHQFLGPLFYYLPICGLAALICAAVIGALNFNLFFEVRTRRGPGTGSGSLLLWRFMTGGSVLRG